MEEEITKEQLKEIKKFKKWVAQIEASEKYYEKYFKRCDELIKIYSAAASQQEDELQNDYRVNILWSNVQTLKPAIYANLPVIQTQRRFLDKDPVANTGAFMLERATQYQTENYDFNSLINRSVIDRLVIGRGTPWIRYESEIKNEKIQVSPSEGNKYADENGEEYESESVTEEDGNYYATNEKIQNESVTADYLHYRDFLTSKARCWEEVRWVARKAHYTKESFEERFGEELADKINFSDTNKEYEENANLSDEEKASHRQCTVYEIWCKDTKQVYWLTKGYKQGMLDEEEDFLGLKGFFPCPKPLFSTLTPNSIIPIPDYIYYQHQAHELDQIGGRIKTLTAALKAVGIYDAKSEALVDLLQADDGTMIPVKDFDLVRDKGGVEGLVSFFPLRDVVQTLTNLYQARDAIKQEIYEISGVSDVLRGASNPHESATAQELKGEYAGIRLSDSQKAVQDFIKEILSIKAQIIANKFTDETIYMTSSAAQFTLTEDGQPVDVSQSLQLLKDNLQRDYRIDIETNSTIATNQGKTKEEIREFMEGFMQVIANITGGIPAPLFPVVKEASLFFIRSFRGGRDLEAALERGMENLKAQQEQAAQQPPPPDPYIQAEQIKAQSNQTEMQMKMEVEAANNQATIAIKQQQSQMDYDVKMRELQIKEQELQLKAQELLIKQQELALESKKIDADIEMKSAELLMKDNDRDGVPAIEEKREIGKTKISKEYLDGTKVEQTLNINEKGGDIYGM